MKTIPVRTVICTQLGLLLLVGCSSDNQPLTFPVSGAVTLDGNPVEGASITFVSDENPNFSATGRSDASGNYQLRTFEPGDGAIEGLFRIRVTKYPSDTEGSPEDGSSTTVIDTKDLSPQEAAAAVSEAYSKSSQQGPPKGGSTPQKQANELPHKYADAEKSGLTYQVVKGTNTHNIELTAKK